MKYIKTYENFEGNEPNDSNKKELTPEEVTAKVAEIVKLATGKNVTPEQIQNEVEKESTEGPRNESIMDIFHHLVELTGRTTFSYETGTTPAIEAVGAFLALAASGIVATIGTIAGLFGLKKLGKKIIGSFSKDGKEQQVDFEQEVSNYSKKKNIDLSKMDPNTEEGKKNLAEMLRDLQQRGLVPKA